MGSNTILNSLKRRFLFTFCDVLTFVCRTQILTWELNSEATRIIYLEVTGAAVGHGHAEEGCLVSHCVG